MPKWKIDPEVYLWGVAYFLITALLHWRITFDYSMLLYLVGAVIGLHLLEILETLYGGASSVFRSVISQALLTIVALLFLTSSTNRLGQGVILFLNLRFFYLQYKEFIRTKSLASWGFPDVLSKKENATNYVSLLMILLAVEAIIFVLV